MNGTDDSEHAAILNALTREITAMAKLSPTVRRVAMQAAGHSVEVEWSDTATGPQVVQVSQPQPDERDHEGSDDNTDEHVVVRAPLVGTFYTAPQPGAPPFVSAGDTVEKGQTLAIIEAMKLMNPLLAECAGTVEKVLVPNGEAVEFDQALIVLAPGEPGSPQDREGGPG
ncbi:acetyl-CoA carboxylase biotin carboxyl carrier protein [Amycolatopsis taiwanensis]|uniref:acetyl-CoA carboxylase biotin carboxyl carrier protein n=1 Tax=Amycolatopsis taiwanensis TaxID=342230 RepID=UPI0004B1482D|nr:biotin/lipoyl-containing protein [Amycolatopsis taiwanensis]